MVESDVLFMQQYQTNLNNIQVFKNENDKSDIFTDKYIKEVSIIIYYDKTIMN